MRIYSILAILNTRLVSLEQGLGIESDAPQPLLEAADVFSIDMDSLLQPLIELSKELEAKAGEGGSESTPAETDQANDNSEVTGDGGTANVADTTSDSATATPAKSGQSKLTSPAGLSERVAAAVDSLDLVTESIADGKPNKQAYSTG